MCALLVSYVCLAVPSAGALFAGFRLKAKCAKCVVKSAHDAIKMSLRAALQQLVSLLQAVADQRLSCLCMTPKQQTARMHSQQITLFSCSAGGQVVKHSSDATQAGHLQCAWRCPRFPGRRQSLCGHSCRYCCFGVCNGKCLIQKASDARKTC